ncbi:universal stress protein [Bosea sp. CS1GBMeth4]|uniref:universal stress protein n=1 Tax=Bosea sp. CS1GBMeth4 TaxID=1892849 RepID=UPI00164467BF|nr:universal stress protein [Bosea sp. CS1GBMeth4]
MERTAAPSQDSGFASIMVPINLGAGAADRARLAVSLAERFGSRLIGIAAQELAVLFIGDGTVTVDAMLVEEATKAATEDLARAEAIFRRVAGHRDDIVWRSAVATPLPFILGNARAADLVVVARQASLDTPQGRMALAPADIVMELGRPLLVTPPDVAELAAESIVIAWRDTREARRAVRDALPFLKQAKAVAIASMGEGAAEQGADDVRFYLARHGVDAELEIRPSIANYAAQELLECVRRRKADLLVTGAYGHSRMREWMLGGMTADLLEMAPVCCLMSH